MYGIARNYRGVQFSQLVTFHGSIFADVHDCAITSIYKCAYFVILFFMVHESTMKNAKIGPLNNFLLYGISLNHKSIIIVNADLLCPSTQRLW